MKNLTAPVSITFGASNKTNWAILANGEVHKVLYRNWFDRSMWRKATEQEAGKVNREYKAFLRA